MFNIGDRVEVSADFEGSITVAGWSRNKIETRIFEVVPFEIFSIKHPKLAKAIKARPALHGEVFLKDDDEIFVLNPASCLSLVESAAICSCPIIQLWAGAGHYSDCPEDFNT